MTPRINLSSQNVHDVFKGKPDFSVVEICSKNFRVNLGEFRASVRIVLEGEEDKSTEGMSEKSPYPADIAIIRREGQQHPNGVSFQGGRGETQHFSLTASFSVIGLYRLGYLLINETKLTQFEI